MNDEYRGPDTDGEDMELFADLGRFQTGAIPVDAAVRQGKAIRVRRRAFGGSALAVAAVLSIGVPVALAGGGNAGVGATTGPNGTYGASSSGGRVTVNPTPFSDGKGHFSGTADGKKWNVDFDNKNCSGDWPCEFQGPNPSNPPAGLAYNSGWGQQGQPDRYTLFLSTKVARATITLQDGEVLRLEAVPVAKNPVVLFALPFGLGVSKIELFDTHGAEIAYSLPFTIKGSSSTDAHWYKPGETPPATTGSVELARGDAGGGRQEIISAHVGPSGPCIISEMDDHPTPTCGVLGLVTGSQTFTPVQPPLENGASGGSTGAGLVASNVDRMKLTYTDGTTSPVTIKSLGEYRFFAYLVPVDKTLKAVTAFDAAGKALPAENNGR